MPHPPVHIIAEVGAVHDGSFGNAQKLVELAASVGADSVKFQTHLAEHETLRDAPSPSYFIGESRFNYYRRTAFSPDQWGHLKQHAEELGIGFLASPFSVAAVELLESIGMDRYKIPSGEVTNLPLLERVKQTGKPVLLSSGMSNWDELDAAVKVFSDADGRPGAGLTVMQCTSSYPCPPQHVGLNVMRQMAERYGTPVGLSDHTLDGYSSYAAVTLGASVIEKHLTFSRAMYGSDARHALEPAGFARLVEGIRSIETMLASEVDKDDTAPYKEMKAVFQKSVAARTQIHAGTTITRAMLDVLKPGTGIPAKEIDRIVGRKAVRTIDAHTLLSEDDLD